MSERIYVNAQFRAKPDCVEKLLAVLADVAPPSRAEPGCIDYCFYQDCDDPARVIAFETWRDMAAIDGHMTLPHFKDAIRKLEGLLEEAPVILKCRKVI